MKTLLLLIAILISGTTMSADMTLQDISQLAWKNRIILVLSGVNDVRYESLFEEYDDEVNDRDVVWFILKDDQVSTNYAHKLSNDFIRRTKNQFPIEKEKMLLIGKDGDIKVRGENLDLHSLFEEIDSMSMRKAEINFKS
jgi:hypothetical protein